MSLCSFKSCFFYRITPWVGLALKSCFVFSHHPSVLFSHKMFVCVFQPRRRSRLRPVIVLTALRIRRPAMTAILMMISARRGSASPRRRRRKALKRVVKRRRISGKGTIIGFVKTELQTSKYSCQLIFTFD